MLDDRAAPPIAPPANPGQRALLYPAYSTGGVRNSLVLGRKSLHFSPIISLSSDIGRDSAIKADFIHSMDYKLCVLRPPGSIAVYITETSILFKRLLTATWIEHAFLDCSECGWIWTSISGGQTSGALLLGYTTASALPIELHSQTNIAGQTFRKS